MTEEIIKECKNCDALGIDSDIGVYYCCLSHRQDDLPKEFICDDYTPNKQLIRLEQENKALQAYKDINEDYKKAWEELNEKYSWLLKRYSNSISDKFAFGVERERLQEERDTAVVEYNNLLLKIVATIPFKGEIGTRSISVADQLDKLIDSYNLLFKIDRMIDKYLSLQYPISCVEPLSNIKMKISKIINNH